MTASFHFDDLDHFLAGAVGPKGERVFYLQADAAGEKISLKVEKQQVAALAEYLHRLLDDVPEVAEAVDTTNIEEPVSAEWTVGPLGVAYDESADKVVVVAEELVDDDDSHDAATARFGISRAQAAAFIEQARDLMAGGRDPCPYCGRPLQPGGTWCPCHN
ncbi:MAG: DUF3090 family protein [Acidimicrobiales bacterium]